MCGCIYGLSRSCTIANTIIHGHGTRVSFLKVLKIIQGFHGYTRIANRISRVFCVRQALGSYM